ncbi:MAG: hypothetical protein AAFX94_05330 [Myxococcota bacterium]
MRRLMLLALALSGCASDDAETSAPFEPFNPCPSASWTGSFLATPERAAVGETLSFLWDLRSDAPGPITVEVSTLLGDAEIVWEVELSETRSDGGFSLYQAELTHPFGNALVGSALDVTGKSARPTGCADSARATTTFFIE